MKLPFLDPDYDLSLNTGMILIIISLLNKTERGKAVLNNDRLHLYLCLLKNPALLRSTIEYSGGRKLILNNKEAYSIAAIAPNLDALFDNDLLKSLLIMLASKRLIVAEYRKKEGFFYSLTENGGAMSNSLSSDYFNDVRNLCDAMKHFQTKSISQLNVFLNQSLRME